MPLSRLRWYQKAWLWVAVAVVAVPMSLATLTLYAAADITIMAFASPIVSALVPVGLWMAALVSKRNWAQFVFAIVTAVVLAVAVWSVSAYLNQLEFESCATIPGDADLCRSLTEGSFQRTTWIGLGLFWVIPLVVLYSLRRRFQPHPD